MLRQMYCEEFQLDDLPLAEGHKLVLTCFACPEQYDMLDEDGTIIAYFRLRHGRFRVCVPNVGGDEVYVSFPEGDGCFTSKERMSNLRAGILSVYGHYVKLYGRMKLSD